MYMIKDLDVLLIAEIVIEIALDIELVAGPGLYTSGHRPHVPGDRLSVHNALPSRGLDRRCRQENIGVAIRDYANALWIYDPQRPSKKVVIYHETKDEYGRSKGFHLHIQGHPRTVRRY